MKKFIQVEVDREYKMIVKCSKCETSFSVDDSKIDGKKFAFDCPNCSQHNIIDNRSVESSPVTDAPEDKISQMDDPSNGFSDGQVFDSVSEESNEPNVSEEIIDDSQITDDPVSDDQVDDEFNDIHFDELNLDDESGNYSTPAEEAADSGLDENSEILPDPEGFNVTEEIIDESQTTDEPVSDEQIGDGFDDISFDELNLDDGSGNDSDAVAETMDFDLDGNSEILQDPEAMNASEEIIESKDPIEDIMDDIELPTDLQDTIEETGSANTDSDDITIDLNALDINLEDEAEKVLESPQDGMEEEGESTTLDLNSLDIDLDMDEEKTEVVAESDDFEDVLEDVLEDGDDSDDITLDLDSLDIELEEDEVDESSETEEFEESEAVAASDVVDDDLTLDLDSLDISLEETEEVKQGEQIEDILPDVATVVDELTDEEESRLSLEDAGLSLDEIDSSSEVEENIVEDDDEDNLKLTIEEVNPDIDMNELAAASNDYVEDILDDEEDNLKLSIEEVNPNIDMDELAANVPNEVVDDFSAVSESLSDGEDIILNDLPEVADIDLENETLITEDFEEENLPEVDLDKYESTEYNLDKAEDLLDIEMDGFDDEYEDSYDHSGRGFLNFSIDFSLKYSRLKAFLRLIGIFHVVFIPHLIVLAIYSILSSMLGVLNWILVLFTRNGEVDFYAIQAKTLKYHLSLMACVYDVVEDIPPFAGSKSIDYPLQFETKLPERRSRFLSLLRLSGAGILLITIPHFLILTVLSFGVLLIYIVSLVVVIFTAKWPNILFDFMVRYLRYLANVAAFVTGLVDTYPSFRFD